MRKFFFSLTAAACAACFATESQAQYSPYAQPGRYTPAAPVAAPYAVQPASVAMRPSTTTYAAAPAVGLKPVNPPSQHTQKLLLASRTTPTSKPIAQTAAKTTQPPQAPQQYWNSSVNSQPWEHSQGASYGAPAGGGNYAPQPDASVGGYGGPVGGGDCGCNGGGGSCGGDACGCDSCGHCCCLHGCLHNCPLCCPGDMVQHMPHFGTTHGYYYFRPYHVMHVFSQQELATRWGGDPRNPYDNTMFQNIYQQMGVDAATQKAREEAAAKNAIQHNSVPTTVQEYVVPTPMPGYGAPNYQGQPQYVPGAVPPGAVPPGAEYVPNK